MESTVAHAAHGQRVWSKGVAELAGLSGVKVMVIDDSNTIRRSAEIFLPSHLACIYFHTPKSRSFHSRISPAMQAVKKTVVINARGVVV